jgi:hypothetical protein
MIECSFYVDDLVCDGRITIVNNLLISLAVVEVTRFSIMHW